MNQKYETYSNQKIVMDSQKVPTNDFEAQNIEKSVKNAKNFKNKETDKNSDSSQSNKQDQNENKANKKLNIFLCDCLLNIYICFFFVCLIECVCESSLF